MVGRLVWLKWRLLVNGVRADRQRAFGLPIVTIGVAAIGQNSCPQMASGTVRSLLW